MLVGSNATRETALVPSIPLLFSLIFTEFVLPHGPSEDILCHVDRKLLKPYGGSPQDAQKLKTPFLTSSDGTLYAVTACRKEHLSLIHCKGGILSKLGLCSSLIEVLAVSPGLRGDHVSISVAGSMSDPTLKCVCSARLSQAAVRPVPYLNWQSPLFATSDPSVMPLFSASSSSSSSSSATAATVATSELVVNPTSLIPSSSSGSATVADDLVPVTESTAKNLPTSDNSSRSGSETPEARGFVKKKSARQHKREVALPRKRSLRGERSQRSKPSSPRSEDNSSSDDELLVVQAVSDLGPKEYWENLQKDIEHVKKGVETCYQRKLRELQFQPQH